MTESTYRRYDTAAEKLPEHVRKRLERDLPRRVLVVDEDGSCRQLIREFTEHQWEVLEASTVEEAQTMMSSLEPVAVISEMDLSEQDAVSFLVGVREQWPDVRRILMSEVSHREGILRAINDAGVHRFIPKPLDRTSLQEVLDEAFSQRRRELAVICMIEDVKAQNDQLARAQSALREREAHLLHSERLAVLGRLTDGLANGIRPLINELSELTVCLGELELDEDDRELLAMGQDAVQSIWDIIEDISRFTRDDQITLNLVPTDLAPLITRAVRFAAYDDVLKTRDLQVRIEDDAVVEVDPRRFRQVLLNLLRNAAEATREGERVEVSLRVLDDEALVTVRDEGTGMPAQVVSLIFDEFFSTKGSAGLGLGLALCKSIVEQHEGRLTCDTEHGKGTRFTIWLPRVD